MARCVWAAAALTALLAGALPARAGDEVAGKSLAELLDLVEKRIERRKEDARLLADYRAFLKREEPKLQRYGESLGRVAGKYRSQEAYAYYLHLYGMYKASLEVQTRLKLQYQKKSRTQFFRLLSVYIGMAWNYIYLDRPAEAFTLMQSAMRGGFSNRVETHLKRMKAYPAMKKVRDDAYLARNLSPGSAEAQWKLCQALAEKAFYPFQERIELLWMRKAFPSSVPVEKNEVDWLLVRNSEKLMDFAAVAKGADAFRRNRKYQDFWAVRSGEALWMLAEAYRHMGKWKEAAAYYNTLKVKHPKHPQAESGMLDRLLTHVKSREKSKAKPDPLPVDWGRGL